MGVIMEVSFKIPYNISSNEYRNFLTNILSRRSKEVELFLGHKIMELYRTKPRIIRSFGDDDIFNTMAYIIANDISIKSINEIDIPLRIVANPSIAIQDNYIHLYIRMSSLGSHPIPNPWSRTFIGYTKLKINSLLGRLKPTAKTILYPYLTVERVEDPRVYMNYYELYHVRAFELYRPISGTRGFTTTFMAKLYDPSNVKELEIVRFKWKDNEFIIKDYRDTFPLNNHYMIVRPRTDYVEIGTIGTAPRNGGLIEISEIIFYPELAPTINESKTGGNCVTKLSSNEYLLIFHSVDKVFGCYYTYAAILDSSGELLAVTQKPILSPRIHDYYGARPGTIFVCGSQLVGNRLIVSAGKDDEIVLILETDIEELMERMKFIKG